jgi:hypothetical protein
MAVSGVVAYTPQGGGAVYGHILPPWTAHSPRHTPLATCKTDVALFGFAADDRCIFRMVTVVYAPPFEGAVAEARLKAFAVELIHPDWSRSLPESIAEGLAALEAKNLADGHGVNVVETIVTDGPPLPRVEDFDATKIETAICQTHVTTFQRLLLKMLESQMLLLKFGFRLH